MYKEILLPLDGSDLAEVALPHTVEMAKATGARVTLLSVIEPITLTTEPGMIGPVFSVAVDMEEERDNFGRYLQQVAERLIENGIAVRTEVQEGDPASKICDYAHEQGIDLIVMSTHGRSGVSRWVYGSVADKVLRGANVPVLLVRAMEKKR